VHRRAFEHQLEELLRVSVTGLTPEETAALIDRHTRHFLASQGSARLRADFEPCVPGRRPVDELSFPGLGSSEEVALFHPGRDEDDTLTFLLRFRRDDHFCSGLPEDMELLATMEALDFRGRVLGTVTGWNRRDLRSLLEPPSVPDDPASVPRARALSLKVRETFGPESVPVDGSRYLGLQTLLHQRFRILLDVEHEGVRIAGSDHEFEVYNEELFGSLYQRLVDTLLPVDTLRQAEAAGRDVGIQAHPWYPVLSIGMQKARFYMLAIAGDLIEQKRMLTNPGWLLRVGLYLELLTCLGIAEAVKEDVEILSPAERDALERAPEFEEIRRRLDVDAWREVWELRKIAFGGGVGGAPTGALNLMRKKAATLGFLHAHHEDLKQAIDLAGPNLQNAQETWHRVFRDAERAVLQMNADAFPELDQFPDAVRDFALWHQSGAMAGMRYLPKAITEAFGDQDGVFPSAARQYRASMNYVARWARDQGLMEYTGAECVPHSASLLEAYLDRQFGRMRLLQRRDGFAGTLEVVVEESAPRELDHDAVVELLQKVELFSALSVDELGSLAHRVRPIHLGHLERIIVQGREGSSLFILQSGKLEVVARNADGTERQMAMLQPPAVVGELAFLLGEKRSATVRALDEATVLEVGAGLLRPLVEQRPAILDTLQRLLEERRARNDLPVGSESILLGLRKAIFGKG